MIRQLFTAVIACVCLPIALLAQQQPLRLWYTQPAMVWEETIPLGNGRLGMMPDGGVRNEKIVLNDITLWSGAPQDANNYEAYKLLPQIRQLLAENKNDEAQALMDKSFVCTGKGSAGLPWGCFQVLGTLMLEYDHKTADTTTTHYERELSLNNAVSTTSYELNGVTYKREYFTSFGDDVGVIRLTASKPGQLNFRVSIDRPENFAVRTEGKELQMSGQLPSGTDTPGMRYIARVQAKLNGGTLTTEGNNLVVKNATEVTLILSMGTDFRNPGFMAKTKQLMAAAMQKPYTAQKQQHITNYQKLFNRVRMQLGATHAEQLPTDERLAGFNANPASDDALPVLFFQFGRYLTISSTRVGLLPPNLQGLWANQVQTPWNGDYHLDVNVQMNHWPVQVSNLPDLDLPLAALIKGLVKPGERTAKAYYNAEGWVAHVITNVWGFTEPGESASWGATKSGSGWVCNNLWEHYAFTNDKKYLQDIYPVLKGAALFYSSQLVTDPKSGYLVLSPSSSPENSFVMPNGKHAAICVGATIDNQIVHELFTNVITATNVLGTDAALRAKLEAQLKKVAPIGRIGSDGRLMEWMEEYPESEPHHRHLSHLYGLFPAPQITPEGTPDLAEACKKSLEARGDDGPSWSIAFKQLFWARLHEGNRAYKLFADLMRPTLKTNINYGAGGGTYPNMFTAGPPFQIDGNFGGEAGLAEMLLQSHAGFIDLLPAIPDQWKSTGSVNGLKARGNYTVSMTWKDGKVTRYTIASPNPRKVKVKVNGEIKEVMATKI